MCTSQKLQLIIARYVQCTLHDVQTLNCYLKLNPPAPRKKSEKRDSLRNMPSTSDLGQKKVKGAFAK